MVKGKTFALLGAVAEAPALRYVAIGIPDELIVGAPGRDLYGVADAGAAYIYRGTSTDTTGEPASSLTENQRPPCPRG